MALVGHEYIRRAESPFTSDRVPSSIHILLTVCLNVDGTSSYRNSVA